MVFLKRAGHDPRSTASAGMYGAGTFRSMTWRSCPNTMPFSDFSDDDRVLELKPDSGASTASFALI